MSKTQIRTWHQGTWLTGTAGPLYSIAAKAAWLLRGERVLEWAWSPLDNQEDRKGSKASSDKECQAEIKEFWVLDLDLPLTSCVSFSGWRSVLGGEDSVPSVW